MTRQYKNQYRVFQSYIADAVAGEMSESVTKLLTYTNFANPHDTVFDYSLPDNVGSTGKGNCSRCFAHMFSESF